MITETKKSAVAFYLRCWNGCASLEQQAERVGMTEKEGRRVFVLGHKVYSKSLKA